MALILIAVCAALATGNNRNHWLFCGNGKTKIMNSNIGGKRQTGTNQRRITGGKFLEGSSSARNLNGGRGGSRGGDKLNSSNVQQQKLSCDLQIRYNLPFILILLLTYLCIIIIVITHFMIYENQSACESG